MLSRGRDQPPPSGLKAPGAALEVLCIGLHKLLAEEVPVQVICYFQVHGGAVDEEVEERVSILAHRLVAQRLHSKPCISPQSLV